MQNGQNIFCYALSATSAFKFPKFPLPLIMAMQTCHFIVITLFLVFPTSLFFSTYFLLGSKWKNFIMWSNLKIHRVFAFFSKTFPSRVFSLSVATKLLETDNNSNQGNHQWFIKYFSQLTLMWWSFSTIFTRPVWVIQHKSLMRAELKKKNLSLLGQTFREYLLVRQLG